MTTPQRKKPKFRCTSVSPLSGLRCGRVTGHRGEHRSNLRELKARVEALTGMMFKKLRPLTKQERGK